MNNRTRNWFKAAAQLDKHDPLLMASIENKVRLIRVSKFEELGGIYKGDLLISDEDGIRVIKNYFQEE